MKLNKNYIIIIALMATVKLSAQNNYISKVWVADNGNGTYKNPILHADYSDPDAIRVGDDFYMVSSSFEDIPGLPILHSRDLVNWSILTYALKRQPPLDYYSKTQHGAGVWAPSIRYHNNEFYIYYPDPDFGIYVIKAKNAAGPWSEPVMVEAGKGLIDPCPLWDDNASPNAEGGRGKTYLVHAYAGSRAGIKSILVIKEMNTQGTQTISEGRLVFDGHEQDPTLEGPKFYKRNGYYYIFAPAGGVATGWQLVMRSKNIYGPYERKVVMDQGSSPTNGPHQGAWVNTQTGEDWFLHFQDKEAYGRVVHLQPMTWVNDWPVIGVDKNGDGKGEPVTMYKKPNVGKTYPIQTPVESDEFNSTSMGLQWQWMGNSKATWYFTNPSSGSLRLFSYKEDSIPNLWFSPNVLQQKFPAEEFMVTTKFTFKPNPKLEGEKAGLTIMGMNYVTLALKSAKTGLSLVYGLCKDADKKKQAEVETVVSTSISNTIFLRVKVTKGAKCQFAYSVDGASFTDVGETFTAEVGKWIGSKVGIFCTRTSQTNDSGFADFDWFRVEASK